jgi:hypothetical protein
MFGFEEFRWFSFLNPHFIKGVFFWFVFGLLGDKKKNNFFFLSSFLFSFVYCVWFCSDMEDDQKSIGKVFADKLEAKQEGLGPNFVQKLEEGQPDEGLFSQVRQR